MTVKHFAIGHATCPESWNNPIVPVEIVKSDAIPSIVGLLLDHDRIIQCPECKVSYQLYYSGETEHKIIRFSILAAERIAAQHPKHASSLIMELFGPVPCQPPGNERPFTLRLGLGILD